MRARNWFLTSGLIMAAGLLTLSPAQAGSSDAEARASAAFDAAAPDKARLRLFLQAMPKGGDLHNHLWGAPYAEDFIAWAGEGGLCVSTATRPALTPAPCDGKATVPAAGLARRDPALYNRVIDSLSVRNYDRGADHAAASGHDQFFSTFERFAAAAAPNIGPMVAVTREYAAQDRVSYVESSANPNAMRAFAEREAGRWDGDFAKTYAAFASGLPAMVEASRKEMDAALAEADKRLDCAQNSGTAGPCAVEVRFQPFVERAQPAGFVFAQMAAAFALVDADPRFVGVNIVNPEDHPVSLGDYALHMRMMRYLSGRYPKVPMALHAGELSLGLVPPRDLTFHINQAVMVAGAKRIGHGVDIAYEHDAPGLLKRMARDKVAVEINLTSNDVILGVKGADHPLSLYRQAGVPVVLSTDDEGVSRIDLTNEYVRAATEHGLRYADLKAMARDSLEYAFLPGKSLRGAVECAKPGTACDVFLNKNLKAAMQWRLEKDFEAFEAIQ